LKPINNVLLVTFARGKVNAINEAVIAEMSGIVKEAADDPKTKAVVLTGQGKFFSFGWDVPELYGYSKQDFIGFLRSFCRLCSDLFLFPKPLVGAMNGHAMAGGYILALTCDHRMMADTAAKISLNEVTFGSTIPISTVEMLRFAAGNRVTELVLLEGRMFNPAEALGLGLVDQVVAESRLLEEAHRKAADMAVYFGAAFTSLKRMIRRPVAEGWLAREEESIREFADIWYLPETRERLRKIEIRG
jgi:enoyl-CoA hydratase/carnithine racemase